MIYWKPAPGMNIADASARAVAIAVAAGEPVQMNFNDTEVIVWSSHAVQVSDFWQRLRDQLNPVEFDEWFKWWQDSTTTVHPDNFGTFEPYLREAFRAGRSVRP